MRKRKFTPETIAEAMGELPTQYDSDDLESVQLSLDDWEVVLYVLNDAAKAAVGLGPESPNSDARRLQYIANEILGYLGDKHEKFWEMPPETV